MPPLAYFGIESAAFTTVLDLLVVVAAVIYLSLIYWTYADARRRIADPMLIGCATAASLFPFVGTLVYAILRPPEYLEDVHERELEIQAAEAGLHGLDRRLCPHCDYPIERDFIRCPSCLRKLKERCVSCSRPLDRAWTICPYCETEVASETPARRRRMRAGSSEASSEEDELTVATSSEEAFSTAVPEPPAAPRRSAGRGARAPVARARPASSTEDLI
ncbi:MAG TPA: zinc ribbon domain-containing protein [Solirubrobacteraceae bacterium]|jgi:hypothetical protein|nr:zinc ribbon domain-containing protein [Solirubrobacteraceae bacterium]